MKKLKKLIIQWDKYPSDKTLILLYILAVIYLIFMFNSGILYNCLSAWADFLNLSILIFTLFITFLVLLGTMILLDILLVMAIDGLYEVFNKK